MKVAYLRSCGVVACLTFAGAAHAQVSGGEDPELANEEMAEVEGEPIEEAPATQSPAPAQSEAADPTVQSSNNDSDGSPDGVRFRFGISGGMGPMIADGGTFTYGGADARFGAQINDLVGVYAQPQLGIYVYGGSAGGLVGTSFGADFTFADRFFVGGGLGYAILNNPSGMELHFRVGGYPIMSKSTEKARRKGLMMGADVRLHFVEGYTFFAPTFSIGYEAF